MTPAERFVDVGARRLWTRTLGAGPGVVLGSGAGRAGVGQAPDIEAAVARFATVISYDRAGTGRSDPPPAPPTAHDMADDLAALLDALAVDRPVLLVGFSMTALPFQLFACRCPADVSALLLLDPTPDEMIAAIASWPAERQAIARRNLVSGPNVTAAMALEMERLVESALEVRAAIRTDGLPDVPLVVAAIDRKGGAVLREHHEGMAGRVPRGRFIAAAGDGVGGHADFMRDQATLVTDLVRELIGR